MRERSFILVASFVAALIVGAVALFAFDSTRKDQIAKGIRVGGVDVGGLSSSEARAKIASALGNHLDEPIIVRRGKHKFTLKPRSVGATFDVDAMVSDALHRSRRGSMISRVIHRIRGDAVSADLPGSITYSRAGVTRFVRKIEHRLDRKPIDASLGFASGGFDKVAGRDGVTVDARDLVFSVQAALDGSHSGPIDVKVRETKPRVSRADLAKEYPELVTIDRTSFKLRLYKHLHLVKSYSVAVGMQGLETPAGLYHIQNKQVDPSWQVPNSAWAGSLAGQTIPGGTAGNPLKARWMGIFNGAGIHGTDELASIGKAESHGCVRMRIPDVIELYDRVDVGTPVYIA